jgi:hypothetical protein
MRRRHLVIRAFIFSIHNEVLQTVECEQRVLRACARSNFPESKLVIGMGSFGCWTFCRHRLILEY